MGKLCLCEKNEHQNEIFFKILVLEECCVRLFNIQRLLLVIFCQVDLREGSFSEISLTTQGWWRWSKIVVGLAIIVIMRVWNIGFTIISLRLGYGAYIEKQSFLVYLKYKSNLEMVSLYIFFLLFPNIVSGNCFCTLKRNSVELSRDCDIYFVYSLIYLS